MASKRTLEKENTEANIDKEKAKKLKPNQSKLVLTENNNVVTPSINTFKNILRNPYNLSETENLSDAIRNIFKIDQPFALGLDHHYTEETIKKCGVKAFKESDINRYNILKAANTCLNDDEQLFFYIVKASLKTQMNGNGDAERGYWGTDMWGKYGFYYFEEEGEENQDEEETNQKSNKNDQTKKILTLKEEEAIKSEDEYYNKKSKTIDTWYDIEGKTLFGTSERLSVDFFSKIFDFYSEIDCEKINSWHFVNQDEESIEWDSSKITKNYEKYLLFFCPKKFHLKIMSKVSIEKTIDLLLKETNKESKANNLEHLLNKLISDTSENYSDDESDSNEHSLIATSGIISLNKESYAKLTHLLKLTKRTALTNLFIQILRKEKSEVIIFETIYRMWKTDGNAINIFEVILNDLGLNNNILSIENSNKQIEMIISLKKPDLLKKLIKKIIAFYLNSVSNNNNCDNVKYLQRAIELINVNEWQSSIEAFFPSFNVDSSSIDKNCSLAKALHEIKQIEAASVCLHKYVAPILSFKNEFNKLKIASYYELYETFYIFNREKELTKLCELLVCNQDKLHTLLEIFLEKKKSSQIKLNNSKLLVELFTKRIKYLEDNAPKMTWIMQANIPGHVEVEDFLKSELQEMIYRGSFYNITSVNSFIKQYSGCKDGYSIEIVAVKNKKEKAYASIKKTSDYFVKIEQNYSKKINLLKSFLKN